MSGAFGYSIRKVEKFLPKNVNCHVSKSTQLVNIYHVIAVNPERFPQVNKEGAQAVIQFLMAPETQQLIGSFGQDKYGQALFTPCAQNSCQLQNPDG